MTSTTLHCSFCGRTKYECAYMIASPEPVVFICDDCIAISAEIVEDRRVRKLAGNREYDSWGVS